MAKNKKIFICLLAGLLLLNAGMASARMTKKIGYQDFTLISNSGESVTLSQFKGKNPVLLVFFATWCPPCNREVPRLIEMQDKYIAKGLKILAVDIDEPADLVNQFIQQKGINYTVLLDHGGQIAEKYKVSGIPTNILFDRQGRVKYVGYTVPDKIEDVL